MKLISGNTSKGGHYSPGIISHGMLCISGQPPIDPATGKLAAEQGPDKPAEIAPQETIAEGIAIGWPIRGAGLKSDH